MNLVEEFIESEKLNLNWLQKLSANYPDVTETRLLARGYAMPEIKPDRIIQPSPFKRLLYFLMFLVTLFSWLFLLSTLRGPRDPLWVYLVFVPFLLFVSVSCLLVNFVKSYNYTIRIDASGMTIRGIFIAWREIVETAIMRQPQPRNVDRFLVIFTRDELVRKLNLFLFGISDRKLASAVEYYKAQYGASSFG
jgi:hypothetical protein